MCLLELVDGHLPWYKIGPAEVPHKVTSKQRPISQVMC